MENRRIIFKCIVGSQAYGTNVEGSDIDIKGVYIQDPMEILTFGYKPQIEVGKDECYYEVRRFIELLQTANPTVLEMLFVPDDCIIQEEPEFTLIKNVKWAFLTKKCRNSFGGYAIQQIKKARGLDKKMNWEDSEMVRKTPLDFCYLFKGVDGGSRTLSSFLDELGYKQEFCGLADVDHIRDGYALYYDYYGAHMGHEPIGLKGIQLEDSNSIRVSQVPEEYLAIGFVHYNKDGYTQHCKKFREYEDWLKNRNVQRYVDIDDHGQKIDGKNMLHCRRLIDTAIEIAETGELNVRRPNADYLISIRKGKVDLEKLLTDAEADISRLDEAYNNCELNDEILPEFCNSLLKQIRQHERSE